MINERVSILTKNLGKSFKTKKSKRQIISQVLKGDKSYEAEEKWVLKDINIELMKGESLGIIGRNGSGKSTLLQLICGTLSATEGSIYTNGKVAALLELGSGFNPDFTGYENIFLNAALLGLTKNEVEAKIDKILSFADIGSDINNPVRTYSSGMVVRLAFSVIANVDADILIIDEALAVGDAFFTQKCMRFISRFREENTLLFVSHDADSILSLCDKAVLLEKGRMMLMGKPKKVIETYTREMQEECLRNSTEENKQEVKQGLYEKRKSENIEDYKEKWTDYRKEAINKLRNSSRIKTYEKTIGVSNDESYGGVKAEIKGVKIVDMEDIEPQKDTFTGGEVVKLTIKAKALSEINNPILGFIVKNKNGLELIGDNTHNCTIDGQGVKIEKGGEVESHFIFTMPFFKAGEYSVTASIADGQQEDHEILHWKNDALLFRSQCSNVVGGITGIAMHSIDIETK